MNAPVHKTIKRRTTQPPPVSSTPVFTLPPAPISGDPMHIAICISGLIRTWRQTLENHYGALIQPPHTYDTFISTWDIDDSKTSTHVIVRKGCYTENRVDFNELITTYHPTMLEFEQEFQWPDARLEKYKQHKRNDTHVGSVLYMYYKIWAADQLRRRFEQTRGFKYDRVVRTRFDLLFSNPISYELSDADLIIPKMWSDNCTQFDIPWENDTFAMGTSEAISAYCDVYPNIDTMFDSGVPFQAEIMLHEQLRRSSLKWQYLQPTPIIVKCDSRFRDGQNV